MHTLARIHPLNSQVLISDSSGGEVPEWVDDKSIVASASCIVVGCYPEQDGPTTIILGPLWEVEEGANLAFAGYLETPSRSVIVSTVDKQTVLEVKVPKVKTYVRVWVNDPQWPDKVIIGVE